MGPRLFDQDRLDREAAAEAKCRRGLEVVGVLGVVMILGISVVEWLVTQGS